MRGAKHIAKVASVVPHDVAGKCVARESGLATERRDTLQGHGKTWLRWHNDAIVTMLACKSCEGRAQYQF